MLDHQQWQYLGTHSQHPEAEVVGVHLNYAWNRVTRNGFIVVRASTTRQYYGVENMILFLIGPLNGQLKHVEIL